MRTDKQFRDLKPGETLKEFKQRLKTDKRLLNICKAINYNPYSNREQYAW